MSDIVPHLGRYCDVVARNGHFFGELVRLSAVSLLVRPKLPASVPPQQFDASEIVEIVDLPDPHL